MPRLRQILLIVLMALLTVTVQAAPPQQQQIRNLLGFITDIRGDLESAADDTFGVGVRPENWTSNIVNTSATYVPDLWFDKELLANEVFGIGMRPRDWFGVTTDVADIIARNTRHDLELIADELYGFEIRPPDWRGAFPVYRCDRVIQNIYGLLIASSQFQTSLDEEAFGFCVQIEQQLRVYIIDTAQLDVRGDELTQLVLDSRGDLERLANEAFGVNFRPVGWAGNTDVESLSLAADAYADLEILADETVGDGIRPDGWIGLVNNDSVGETYRNLRHDLEILANALVPTFPSIEGERPRGWTNRDLLRYCDLRTQDLVLVLESNFREEGASFDREDYYDVGAEEYCDVIFDEGNQFAEDPPLSEAQRAFLDGGRGAIYESDFAFTYLDLNALEYMGVMPRGTKFRAWYRNFGDSTMMFISGENFALYVDRRWTDMPQDVFDNLPTLEGIRPLTFCDADWCNGPGPTPTPTGGALESLAMIVTPSRVPTTDPNLTVPLNEKTRVNFENVRITYVQDDEVNRTARVSLELCEEPQLITCESVIRVVDNNSGAELPVVSQTNNLPVYQFNYGYTSNLTIESATIVSTDIFVSDPTVPRN